MIDVKAFSVGYMGTNSYVVQDKNTGVVAVVDPGCEDSLLTRFLDDIDKEKIRYILLTHGHFDHIGGALFYAQRYNAEVVISLDDADFLTDGNLNLSANFGMGLEPFEADIILKDEDVLSLGESSFQFIHTPGHTRGSGCFLFEEDKIIFSGDTLFFSSIGRTDFVTGNPVTMLKSLQRLRDIDGDYKVFPGHDRSTTLDRERKNNPYLR